MGTLPKHILLQLVDIWGARVVVRATQGGLVISPLTLAPPTLLTFKPA